MSVCKYCGKKIDGLDTEYCSKECEVETQAYLKKVNKYKALFLAGIFLPAFAMPVLNKSIYIIIATFIIGIVVTVLPFSTPQLIEVIGIKKSQKIARYIGIFIILVAVVGGIFTYI